MNTNAKIRQCRHYDWKFGGPHCEKGCTIESPALRMAPCFPNNRHTPCEFRDWVTQEEIDAEEAEFDERFKFIMAARDLIVQAGKQRGFVTCPKCGGKLDYAVSPANGHIGAACETSGCLNWLE